MSEPEVLALPLDWSSAGILYNRFDNRQTQALDIYLLPLDADGRPGTPEPLVAHPDFSEHRATFSPNGRFIAYQSDEEGAPEEIFVRPVHDPDSQLVKVSTGGGTNPRWSDDGDELYYLRPDLMMMAATVETNGETFRHISSTELFRTRLTAETMSDAVIPYDVSGSLFLMPLPGEAAQAPISVIQHWQPPDE